MKTNVEFRYKIDVYPYVTAPLVIGIYESNRSNQGGYYAIIVLRRMRKTAELKCCLLCSLWLEDCSLGGLASAFRTKNFR